jgi:carboxypeptidase Q
VKRTIVSMVLALLPSLGVGQGMESPLTARYRADAERIVAAALADSSAWRRLAELTDRFGSRLSGSRSLEAAIDWVLAQMRADGLDSVRGEPVRVPHWVRGTESAELVAPRALPLHMLGLGGSVGTPPQGITAPVLVVTSFDDLTRHAAEAKGKIVLFDVPFPAAGDPFDAYGNVVAYRVAGASAAAKVGAVASLIRSVAAGSLQSPHTGLMRYDTTTARIPHAALSVEDAELLHRMQDRGERVVVRLRMQARTLPDAPSRNVVAELRGRERPDEVVVLGGHIDSWDVGQGAMDDGGGVVAAWEAVRLLKRLGLRPRRTVRVVLWTSEEFGGVGGAAYRDAHLAELDRHVLAIESDNGAFAPLGWRYTGSGAGLPFVRQIDSLLAGLGPMHSDSGYPETDVAPLERHGVPLLGLKTDPSRYFWYHHSAGDTMDKLDPREVARCVAAMAVAAYVAAEMPERLH